MNNTDVVKRYFSAIEDGNLDTLETVLAPNFVFRHEANDGPMDRTEFLGMIRNITRAMPDWQFNATNIQGDNPVETKVEVTATHTGPFDGSKLGLGTIAATRKEIRLPKENGRFTVRNGQITEHLVDKVRGGGLPGILEQLGVTVPQQR